MVVAVALVVVEDAWLLAGALVGDGDDDGTAEPALRYQFSLGSPKH
jgi:hypothetical protein